MSHLFPRSRDSQTELAGLVLAQEEARLLNHSFIGTEHLLLGLISEGEGVAAQALERLDVSLQAVRNKVEQTVGVSARTREGGSPPFTPRAKKVLELSLREALQLGHNYIGAEHILLGIAREGEGVGAQVLTSCGADLPKVRQQVIQLLASDESDPARGTSISRGIVRRRLLDPRQGTSTEQVGKEWTARVVRAGRTPPEYEAAYEELEDMLESIGIALDDSGVIEFVVRSVHTNNGPGLELSITRRVEDEPEPEAGLEDEDRGETP